MSFFPLLSAVAVTFDCYVLLFVWLCGKQCCKEMVRCWSLPCSLRSSWKWPLKQCIRQMFINTILIALYNMSLYVLFGL